MQEIQQSLALRTGALRLTIRKDLSSLTKIPCATWFTVKKSAILEPNTTKDTLPSKIAVGLINARNYPPVLTGKLQEVRTRKRRIIAKKTAYSKSMEYYQKMLRRRLQKLELKLTQINGEISRITQSRRLILD